VRKNRDVMESRRNQFSSSSSSSRSNRDVTSFPRNCIVGDGPTDGPTNQPTDRWMQSLIEVLFAPKNIYCQRQTIKTTDASGGENGIQINIRGRKLENKNDKKTKEKSEKWREMNLLGSKLMASTIHKWWPILRQYYFNIDSMRVVTPYPADRPGRCWSDHLALSIEVKEHRGGASVNVKGYHTRL
jgi:hypothetical protein